MQIENQVTYYVARIYLMITVNALGLSDNLSTGSTSKYFTGQAVAFYTHSTWCKPLIVFLPDLCNRLSRPLSTVTSTVWKKSSFRNMIRSCHAFDEGCLWFLIICNRFCSLRDPRRLCLCLLLSPSNIPCHSLQASQVVLALLAMGTFQMVFLLSGIFLP